MFRLCCDLSQKISEFSMQFVFVLQDRDQHCIIVFSQMKHGLII